MSQKILFSPIRKSLYVREKKIVSPWKLMYAWKIKKNR